jgi:hypothetical protein
MKQLIVRIGTFGSGLRLKVQIVASSMGVTLAIRKSLTNMRANGLLRVMCAGKIARIEYSGVMNRRPVEAKYFSSLSTGSGSTGRDAFRLFGKRIATSN